MATGRPAVTRYGAVAVTLHWLIAALLLANVAIGLIHDDLPRTQGRAAIAFHESTGILVLLLSLVRLGWRLRHPAPPYPAGLPGWERAAARAVQAGFYLIMIGMPLTGWVMVSGGGAEHGHAGPLRLYWLVPWPRLGFVTHAQGAAAQVWDVVGGAHGVLAWLAYLLILLHVGAALKHQYFDRDAIMARMAPRPRRT